MPHYFDAAPKVASARRTVGLSLHDVTVELSTDRGVFSAERVDPGTRLLLQEAPAPPPTGNVLDLGCGYGPIAVVVALRAPGARVWAVDVNERALALTIANAGFAKLGNMTVCEPGHVPHDLQFAAIYSNPPVRVGREALHDLLRAWIPRGAVTYLVVNKHLGSDSLAAWMRFECGWSVTRLISRVAYRVLEVRPPVPV